MVRPKSGWTLERGSMSKVELLARANRIPAKRSSALEKLREDYWPRERDRTKAKLSVDRLVIAYEDVQTGELTEAVHKVSLDIAPGEFVTIVGLSGCGKSSFLSAVAGLLKPRQGSIALNGTPVGGGRRCATSPTAWSLTAFPRKRRSRARENLSPWFA